MIDLYHRWRCSPATLPWARDQTAALAPRFARQARRAVQWLSGRPVWPFCAEWLAARSPPQTVPPAHPPDGQPAVPQARQQAQRRGLVQRWARRNVVWQHFSGMLASTNHACRCDATQIGRFRTAVSEAGVEELLKATIDTAVIRAIGPAEFERLIVDATVQERPLPTRWITPAGDRPPQVVSAATNGHCPEARPLLREGQGLAAQGRQLRPCQTVQATQEDRQAPAHHPLGIVLREVGRKINRCLKCRPRRCRRTRSDAAPRAHPRQQPKTKEQAVCHARTGSGALAKARKPYEFGVKVSVAVTHRQGLMVGARSFTSSPYERPHLGWSNSGR